MGQGYPKLIVDMKKIRRNSQIITEMCKRESIDVACVIKGYNGIPSVAEEMAKSGCSQLASSRMEQIKEIKLRGFGIDTLLLRIPMMSEVEEVVKYADISLNSEKIMLEKLNEVSKQYQVRHRVILMRDLGDLREGIYERDALTNLAVYVENKLDNLILEGIGSNLSCYGSIMPTEENLNELVENAMDIENAIGRELKTISGGGTSTLPLLHRNKLPQRINHLRIGEAIICALDLPLYWDTTIEGLEAGVFSLVAEIVEIQTKPSYPVGIRCVNAFGEKPEYEDKGVRLRAILAIGNKDVGSYTTLIPRDEGIELVGASSDHLILDIENAPRDYHLGDLLTFDLFYQGVLFSAENGHMNIELKY
ncbi:MAG: alanine racemase [Tissierellales bacterium]|nr:alanine racemase [Tissierellales bacterium]MBN2828285.1 alanine racemase [Tissierellales bacterium]